MSCHRSAPRNEDDLQRSDGRSAGYGGCCGADGVDVDSGGFDDGDRAARDAEIKTSGLKLKP